MVTISRYIKFCTSEFLGSHSAVVIFKALKKVFQIYNKCGFKVILILIDDEFEVLWGWLSDLGIKLSLVSY